MLLNFTRNEVHVTKCTDVALSRSCNTNKVLQRAISKIHDVFFLRKFMSVSHVHVYFRTIRKFMLELSLRRS